MRCVMGLVGMVAKVNGLSLSWSQLTTLLWHLSWDWQVWLTVSLDYVKITVYLPHPGVCLMSPIYLYHDHSPGNCPRSGRCS